MKITGVRSDGYHLLDSLFVPVSLYDKIEISELFKGAKKNTVKFKFDKSRLKTIPKNTVEKSLDLFQKLYPELPHFKVTVQKNIPMGAGMGGGSSNAGVIIKYLAQKYLKAVPRDHLIDAASRIGADVPFFVGGKSAWVSGIGEKLEEVSFEPLSFVIVKPGFSVSTKDAYSWYDAQTTLTQLSPGASSSLRPQFGLSFLKSFLQNDLELAVIKNRPQIDAIKKSLLECGALGSLMTGSGSAVFGVFKSEQEAKIAASCMKKSELSKDSAIYTVKSIA